MTEETRDTGIPTRAIHEAWLDLEQAHSAFESARDQGGDQKASQREFQHAIKRFYELLRPHIKHEPALSEYWNSDLPDYTGWDPDTEQEARKMIYDKGTGVYQIQKHSTTTQLEQRVLTNGGMPKTYQEWHDYLGFRDRTEMLFKVEEVDDGSDGTYYIIYFRCAVLPLRELKRWRAREQTVRESGDGFMEGETSETTRYEFEPPAKLIAAKRLLVDVADKLGALSDFEASTQRTEITREDLEKVEAWRQEQLDR